MSRQIEGSYGYKRVKSEYQTRPILAGAFEGETDHNLAHFLCNKAPWINCEGKVYRGLHGIPLIDKAITLKSRLQRDRGKSAIVVPVVLYDIESLTDQSLDEAKDAIIYGKAKGVHVFVNAPTIERWLLMHFKTISANESIKTIEQRLVRELKNEKMPVYSKPGSTHFFDEISQFQERALSNCAASNHIDYDGYPLPCMCDLIALLKSYRR